MQILDSDGAIFSVNSRPLALRAIVDCISWVKFRQQSRVLGSKETAHRMASRNKTLKHLERYLENIRNKLQEREFELCASLEKIQLAWRLLKSALLAALEHHEIYYAGKHIVKTHQLYYQNNLIILNHYLLVQTNLRTKIRSLSEFKFLWLNQVHQAFDYPTPLQLSKIYSSDLKKTLVRFENLNEKKKLLPKKDSNVVLGNGKILNFLKLTKSIKRFHCLDIEKKYVFPAVEETLHLLRNAFPS